MKIKFDTTEYLNKLKSSVSLILTGTSLGETFEKKILIEAKKQNMLSVSFIEHWSMYKERFLSNGKMYYPNYILVNDEVAVKQAVNQGLPSQWLVPIGSPSLELKKIEAVHDSKEALKKSLKIRRDQKIVVFILKLILKV